MAQKAKQRTNKVRLSRERIVKAAVALADCRRLRFTHHAQPRGRALDAAPMALYRHVANKEDLLDGMVDVVLGEMYPPAIKSDWKVELRNRPHISVLGRPYSVPTAFVGNRVKVRADSQLVMVYNQGELVKTTPEASRRSVHGPRRLPRAQ